MAKFQRDTFFTMTEFQCNTDFSLSAFMDRTYIGLRKFNGETKFNNVLFEGKEKILFEIENLSRVSFMNTNIIQVRFTGKSKWEENDKFKIIEEEWLEEYCEGITIDNVITVYRNLRENYERRLRFDEAGKFFIKEMEIKRKYREGPSMPAVIKQAFNKLLRKWKIRNVPKTEVEYKPERNSWWRRNLLSLTGLYYQL